MLRTVSIAFFLLIFFIISLPFYAVIPLIAKFDPKRADWMAQNMVCKAFDVIISLSGMRLTVEGKDNVPSSEPVLYIANHRSYFDIVTTYPHVAGLTGYVAKQEIDKVPLLKYWMRLLHGLTFDREDPRSGMNMILTAIDYVKKGYSIFIFPEGTRSKDGKMGEFKGGSFKVATRTGCAIVPVAISGSDDMFERHVPFVRASDVRIRFGTPIRPKELSLEDRKHIARFVQEKIEEML